MITVSVERNELKDWQCIITGPGGKAALYTGPSAGKAAKVANSVRPHLETITRVRTDIDKDGKWFVAVADGVIREFGVRGNKAADFADEINKALAEPTPMPKLAAEE